MKTSNKIKLFCLTLVFKFAMDFGFWKILVIEKKYFDWDFSLAKYLIGTVICLLLSASLLVLTRKNAISFFVYFIFLFQIMPISIVYGMMNESTLYYLLLILGFVLLMLIAFSPNALRKKKHKRLKIKKDVATNQYIKLRLKKRIRFNNKISRKAKIIYGICIALTIILLAALFVQNGLPTLDAIDIYRVYDLRSSGSFTISKYFGYLMTMVANAILPFLIVRSIMNKNIIYALIASLALFIIYLYTGHKTQLFYIALALIVAIWSKNKNFHYQFFQVFIVGTTLLIILTQISTPLKGLFGEVYSLLIRRAIFDPAYLKFIHYDYFCNHPKLGLYGAIPRVLIFREIPYYGKNGYAFDIGRIYFGKPQMSADTGALAEGFSRFGYIGIFIIFSLIGVFLRLINAFERKSNTRITLSIFLCPIYSLSEMPLIGGLVFGSYFAFLLILLFYRPEIIMVYHSLPKKKKRVAKIKKKAKNRIYLERRCAYGN